MRHRRATAFVAVTAAALAMTGCHKLFDLYTVDDVAVEDPDAGHDDAAMLVNTAEAMALGSSHTCAMYQSGIRCWGNAAEGQLGYGSTVAIGDDEPPYVAGNVDVGFMVKALAAGAAHTCALSTSDVVRCWGSGLEGRLGTAATTTIGDDELASASPDVQLQSNSIALAAGAKHTCVILETLRVRCWGNGADGRLGYSSSNNIGDDESPGTNLPVMAGNQSSLIAAGDAHTCTKLSSGNVRCWGEFTLGRIGVPSVTQDIGDDEHPETISPVALGTSPITQLVGGGEHTCSRHDDGTVRCWGNGADGRLGYGGIMSIGDNEDVTTAGPVVLGNVAKMLSAGHAHTCALLGNGRVRCWGDNMFGQLGLGHTNDVGDNEVPGSGPEVNVGGEVDQIWAGGDHTCARLVTGAIRCWGRNDAGQLGYGNLETIGDNETPASAGDVLAF